MVIHAQVHEAVGMPRDAGFLTYHQQCRGLLPSGVAAGLLCGFEGSHEPLGEGDSGAVLEGRSHVRDDLRPDKNVALSGEVPARGGSCPWLALGAGVVRRSPFTVNDANLADLGLLIALQEPIESLLWLQILAQECQSRGPEIPIDRRLCRDRANSGLRPGNHSAYREVPRLHSDAEVAGGRVPCDN